MEVENSSADDMSDDDTAKRIKRRKYKGDDNKNGNFIYSGGQVTEQERKTVLHVTIADDVTKICLNAFLRCTALISTYSWVCV